MAAMNPSLRRFFLAALAGGANRASMKECYIVGTQCPEIYRTLIDNAESLDNRLLKSLAAYSVDTRILRSIVEEELNQWPHVAEFVRDVIRAGQWGWESHLFEVYCVAITLNPNEKPPQDWRSIHFIDQGVGRAHQYYCCLRAKHASCMRCVRGGGFVLVS